MTADIDFSHSEQYTLSVRLSEEGFTYSLFDPLGDPPVACFDYAVNESVSLTANVKRMFRDVECLNRRYRRVNVLVAGRRVTYVPLPFFDDEQAKEVFYYNHLRRDNEAVLYNIMQRNDIVVVFGMDSSAMAYIGKQYPDAKFYAQASPLMEYFASKSRLGNSRKIYANLRSGEMDVFAYERGRLLAANAYACQETADRLYFLLYLWKQLGFGQERDELHLTGNPAGRDELVNELKKYLRQVFVMTPSVNADLQAITLCE